MTFVVAKGAKVAQWLGQYNTKYSTRLRWIPICDVGEKQKVSNLRLYNPQTNKTVNVSSSCQVAGMSLSDNYVVYFDNWVPDATGAVSAGDGDLMMMDLRDGSKRPDPLHAGMNVSAVPIGKSKFVVYSTNPAAPSGVSFYNANTSASTKAAALPEPIYGVSASELGNSFGVFATKGVNQLVADAYYVGF